MKLPLTMHQFIQKEQTENTSGIFSSVMEDVALGCRMVATKLRYGHITGEMSKGSTENASGDKQVPMDILANNIFIELAENNGGVAAIVSEELEEIYICKKARRGKYIIVIDPLDGSGNLDINAPVATIFSICLAPPDKVFSESAVLECARTPVAAGICIYGLSTFMAYTTGNGVNGFTQDLEFGTFFFTHKNMKIADRAGEVAINFSNKEFWNPAISRYIEECFKGENGPRKRYFNTRWYASAAAELNRILNRGGVFLYPACSNGKPNGVLRKVYEAWPMAFLVEAAGGMATDGVNRILDVSASTLHERTPFVMGTPEEVEIISSYHKEFASEPCQS